MKTRNPQVGGGLPSPETARPDTATVGERVRAQVLWGVFWHHGIRDPKPGKRRVVLKMGRRGPAPAPAQLKLLGGRSPGRDSGGRRVTPPAAFERVAPECPDWLPPGAKDMWGRVVPELAALNLLKESDLGVLTSFCVAWDQLMQAVTAYREQGFIATNARSRRVTVHPAVAAARAATRTFWCSRANWGARQALRRIWLLCWRRRGPRRRRVQPVRPRPVMTFVCDTIEFGISASADAGQSPRGGWNPDSGRHAPQAIPRVSCVC